MKNILSFSGRILLFGTLFVFAFQLSYAQGDVKNWHHKDLKKDKYVGISTTKTYAELLKGRKSRTVIVAIIDSGVDTLHEDLQGKLWINEDEVPGNGIDDDKNGYIDDIHGWNFLGNPDGRNIHQESYEATRVYVKYKSRFEKVDTNKLTADEKADYYMFVRARKDFLDEKKTAKADYQEFQNFDKNYSWSKEQVGTFLNKETWTLEELKAIKTDNEKVGAARDYLVALLQNGFTDAVYTSWKDQVTTKFKYHYNETYDARGIVGDNPDEWNSNYGNADVKGPGSDHGTFVAGIVAANRENGIGAEGICEDVKIMIIRVVPSGDERDKDVANGIRYAVDNGAMIINMSFGKAYSPQKSFVDEAVKYADEKGVLMIHASGNDGEDNDTHVHYPTPYTEDGKLLTKLWIDVGASGFKANKNLPASFSNYGQKSVDIFAPGVEIFGLNPENEYGASDGTSAASPVVAGVAALIMSYFPELTALQVKEVLLTSAVPLGKKKVVQPGSGLKVPFSTLSVQGGVVNAYNAVLKSLEMTKTATP